MRLFVAVNIPASVRRALARLAGELAAMDLPVRWVDEEAYHLTLRWLGDRNEEAGGVVAAILHEVAAGREPFEVGFEALGAYPSPRRPRVIWIGVESGPRLRLLRDELERRLARDGFGRDERSFQPHVTLGRARRAARAGAFRPFAALGGDPRVAERFAVRSVDLMRSRLGTEGVRYHLLASAELGAEGLPAGRHLA